MTDASHAVAVDETPAASGAVTTGNLDVARERAITATAEHARRPQAAPAARGVVYLVSLLLLALAGVAIWDILVRTDLVQGPELIASALDWATATDWNPWLIAVGAAAVMLGLLLLVAALKPRRTTHLRANAEASAWLRPVDVARLVSRAARKVPGVISVGTSATRKRITLTVHGGGATAEELRDRIARAVEPVVADALAEPPAVVVRVTANRETGSPAEKEVEAR
ncbi:DUF6286 domain-containing protein [Corynebacterium sp. 335C]